MIKLRYLLAITTLMTVGLAALVFALDSFGQTEVEPVGPQISQFDQLGMPRALNLWEFYVRYCFDAAADRERLAGVWVDIQAVKDLSVAAKIPIQTVFGQLRHFIFEDPHCQFFIRVWDGPAKSPEDI